MQAQAHHFVVVPHHGVGHVVFERETQAPKGAIVALTNGWAWRPFNAERQRLEVAQEGRFNTGREAFEAFLAAA